ncbi:MAG: hypothetical protein A2Y62_20400 [Candidatus Fischerbacteria bacterium RBG_13_37_8]|uniref:Uncharacterized protein n=1 Tax=Candidatus Fischerbacteria bacterium RBG_13_37_8 TaxID=1817863 RepID=A0A1F5VX29_9BACT|nr:MAG: hypothetical protein A2Y62_20400 [Candidatus Fischerbacteria bacterium RBG_13_37_8]
MLLFGEKKYESRDKDTSPKAQIAMVLTPNQEKSFASICATDTIIGILGDRCALQAYLPSPDGILKKGSYSVVADFTKGPELWRYIQPPAGPHLPPIPLLKFIA